jgi:hypothetical protein
VNKVYKNAATADPDDTCPLAGAGFEFWNADNSAKVRDEILTDANGVACFDHLPLDTDLTFVESFTPPGFAGADATPVSRGAAESD